VQKKVGVPVLENSVAMQPETYSGLPVPVTYKRARQALQPA
jgi:hypothetical protein